MLWWLVLGEFSFCFMFLLRFGNETNIEIVFYAATSQSSESMNHLCYQLIIPMNGLCETEIGMNVLYAYYVALKHITASIYEHFLMQPPVLVYHTVPYVPV
jgi:hypothetical protein